MHMSSRSYIKLASFGSAKRSRAQLNSKLHYPTSSFQKIPGLSSYCNKLTHTEAPPNPSLRLHQLILKQTAKRTKLLSHYKGIKLSPDSTQKSTHLNSTITNITDQLKTLGTCERDDYLPTIDPKKCSHTLSYKLVRIRMESTRNYIENIAMELLPTKGSMLDYGKDRRGRRRKLKIFSGKGGYYAKNFSLEVREGTSLKPHNVILSEVVRNSPRKKHNATISFHTLPKDQCGIIL
eukprot:TRINITY_DN10983_c0_g1_i2.p1 TRINITY_DN10983_c0_g1~~TRINITY_DN10983_c0_g1_i2.p1  ORF type:complete len:236 (-),score=25.11 TRINITY_DN10983_c0_g1_i2:114-821(-)